MTILDSIETPNATVYFRRLALPEDVETIHPWVTSPKAIFWGLNGATKAKVLETYADICQRAHVFIGSVEYHGTGNATQNESGHFLIETYSPRDDEVGNHYSVEPGDRGMHVLLAPTDAPRSGFSRLVFHSVLEFLFRNPDVKRVVVEPDIRNSKIHRLNRDAGFSYQKPVFLSSKVGHLAFLTRAQYLHKQSKTAPDATHPLAHLGAEQWHRANAWLLAKAITEFTHERLVFPTVVSAPSPNHRPGAPIHDYCLQAPGCSRLYEFQARRFALDHLQVVAGSLRTTDQGHEQTPDLLQFVIDFRDQLNLGANVLPVYLEELTNTLNVMAFKFKHQTSSAADLVHADFQEVERAMLEGHPCFVANSGRMGFDIEDQPAFTPEACTTMHLEWLAVHHSRAHVSTLRGLSYKQLLESELDNTTRERFNQTLVARGLEPNDYVWIPVHPWQWSNRLQMAFVSDIATSQIVHLGKSDDTYQAQQSVRTVYNRSTPNRRYVKMALSVLNMGFMRGLSADYLRGTPAINEWVASRLQDDPELTSLGFRLLKEVAGVGYRHPDFDRVEKKSPYRKMLATLWRESPLPLLTKGQRIMTFAALLHRDANGYALLPQLVLASGVEPVAWLQKLLRIYLLPIAHCLFAHELAFMPHGENLILVLENNVPAGMFLKDIAEEVALMSPDVEVPKDVERIRVDVPTRFKALGIHTDLFDCYLRQLAPIVTELPALDEMTLWRLVAHTLEQYQARHPELKSQFHAYDLFAPQFLRSCLNRLQLRNNRQMVDLTSPTGALQFAGTLDNPIAQFRTST